MIQTAYAMTEVTDMFKRLPGHERQYTPQSEYLFKKLQPALEDLLFLGRSYESLFDRFEVLRALVFADVSGRQSGDVWGPPGRFAWKGGRGRNNPLNELIVEAEKDGASWSPLHAKMFSGSLDRFKTIAVGYRDLIMKFGWY